MKWQGTPIRSPLLRLPVELSTLAIECFECILRYCGDLPPDPELTEVKCVYTILMVSRVDNELEKTPKENFFVFFFFRRENHSSHFIHIFISNLFHFSTRTALSQASNASRRSLLSAHEANHNESLVESGLKSACLALAQHFGRLFHLFGRITAILDGASFGGGIGSSSISPRYRVGLPVKFAENAALRWPQECAQRRGGDGCFGRKVCDSNGWMNS